jgi:histidyl-tRNA synthetase
MLTQHLRRELLIDAECDLAGRSAKGQLRQATRSGAELAAMVGLPVIAADTVRLRDLETGAETDVSLSAIDEWLEGWFGEQELSSAAEGSGGNGGPLAGEDDAQ